MHETGTYNIVEQSKLRRACTNVQTGQSLNCSHQSMNEIVDASSQVKGTKSSSFLTCGRNEVDLVPLACEDDVDKDLY